jgi:hypothetical protein
MRTYIFQYKKWDFVQLLLWCPFCPVGGAYEELLLDKGLTGPWRVMAQELLAATRIADKDLRVGASPSCRRYFGGPSHDHLHRHLHQAMLAPPQLALVSSSDNGCGEGECEWVDLEIEPVQRGRRVRKTLSCARERK